MRRTTILSAVALVSTAACSHADVAGPRPQDPQFAITQECTKTPGPTDQTTSKNPAGGRRPGSRGRT
jgi:hypothetical protein